MRWTHQRRDLGRSAALSGALTSLWLVACSYDWTVPSGGTGGTGGTPSSSSSGDGGGGGWGAGGAALDGGDAEAGPTSCSETTTCDDCRDCVVNGLPGTAAECWDYVFCVTSCAGDTACILGCGIDHPGGHQVREAIIEQCTTLCGGLPACS